LVWQFAPQHAVPSHSQVPAIPSQFWIPGGQTFEVVLVVDEELLLDDDDDDEEEVDAAVVAVVDGDDDVVVAATHAVAVLRLDAGGQPEPHTCPAAQQVSEEPLPHGVVPDGQPHRPWLRSTHATPRVQHAGPHGVAPAGQQHDVDGSEHVCPLAQQPVPHDGAPAGHVAALPRNGWSNVAAPAAPAAARITFNAPRRDRGAAMARDSSSKCSFTGVLLRVQTNDCSTLPTRRPRSSSFERATAVASTPAIPAARPPAASVA
jgi:hypothetical protein